jgi:osmotically inducible protein OsmC
MERTSTAVWRGAGQDGAGTVSTQSGSLKEHPYHFHSRFVSEDGKSGTNPEELIGAAHAGCYTMALAFMLSGAGRAPEELRTTAAVKIEKVEGANTISGIKLDVTGKVPGMSPEAFQEIAQKAKTDCPVSRALASVPITLEARLA